MPDLTFVTGNAHKAAQLSWHLQMPVKHRDLDVPEIQGLDLAEIVAAKTQAAFALLGSPVLVEDTSLRFMALGRLPGPLIKWFLEELGNAGCARLLDGRDSRQASAEVLFGYFDGERYESFAAQIEGTIAATPRGKRGFGWDPIFIPAGARLTWGEMDKEQQLASSMRAHALRKLQQFLSTLQGKQGISDER
jgi:non-canonical purine NTP pyrophosphatase (RdgB/HAM1 family)